MCPNILPGLKNEVAVAVVHRSSLKLRHYEHQCQISTFECKVLALPQTPPLTIAVVYRPPKRLVIHDPFQHEFEQLVSELGGRPGRLLLCGDFNVHMDDTSSPGVAQLVETLESHDLHQAVCGSTHTSGHTLDLVITKPHDLICSTPLVLYPTIADHSTIVFELLAKKPVAAITTSRGRDYRHMDELSFQETLQHRLKSLDIQSKSPDEVARDYNNILREALDDHAPTVIRKRRSNTRYPWINDDIRQLRRERRALERRWRKSKLHVHREMFEKKKDLVNQHISTAKREFFERKLYCSDQILTFTILNNLMKDDQPSNMLVNDTLDSEAFSRFFVDKVEHIIANTKSSELPSDFRSSTISPEYQHVLSELAACFSG